MVVEQVVGGQPLLRQDSMWGGTDRQAGSRLYSDVAHFTPNPGILLQVSHLWEVLGLLKREKKIVF